MTKKAGTARNSAQRQRTRVQKNFAVVRPDNATEELPESVKQPVYENSAPADVLSPVAVEPETAEVTAPKGSAAARLAARRKQAQKAQQRTAASLITAEHFDYVKKELLTIGVLATVMTIAIVVLYFVLGQGA